MEKKKRWLINFLYYGIIISNCSDMILFCMFCLLDKHLEKLLLKSGMAFQNSPKRHKIERV